MIRLYLPLFGMILRRENFEICAKTRGDSREEDLYADETGRVVFGDDYSRYPLDFMKGALLFTTHIRTLFSGRKFTSFRDMLHDSVLPKHHKELKHIRPLFDDPEYDSFRRGNDLRLTAGLVEFPGQGLVGPSCAPFL